MKPLWIVFICICVIVVVSLMSWFISYTYKYHFMKSHREPRRYKESVHETNLRQRSVKCSEISTITVRNELVSYNVYSREFKHFIP